MRQLPLDLVFRPSRAREDYVVSDANAPALAQIDGWRGWPGGKAVLIGPAGAGKSHLAHVWAADTGAAIVTPAALPRLPDAPAIAVEDADAVAGDARAETALFHAHNTMAETGRPLLLTARRAPAQWGIALPDLRSRLEAAMVVDLPPPDDALLGALLAKLFADRRIAPPPALIPWLSARIERSAAAAQDAVARIDAASLAEGAPVGMTLARRTLAA